MNRPEIPSTYPPLPIGEDPQLGYTLPSSLYTDPAAFEREKSAIFYRNWHYVGHTSQFEKSGDYLTVQIADENIFVIRGEDGKLRGFHNVCRHRAHQLVEGQGNKKRIVCPYHAWSYSHTGALVSAPNTKTMPAFDKSRVCLVSVRVEEFCKIVFINLDPEADSLASQAPDLEADIRHHVPDYDKLRVVDPISFGPSAIAANWKVVIDNYVECYHCGIAHRDFVDLIDMSEYQMDTHDIWSRQLGPKVKPDNSAYAFAPDAPLQHSVFWYLWPTTAIAMLPGQPNLQISSILPDGHGHTSFAGHWLSVDPADAQGPARDYLSDVLGPEDTALCESVQRGLNSRSYDQGKFVVDSEHSGVSEHAVHHFHKMVMQSLE